MTKQEELAELLHKHGFHVAASESGNYVKEIKIGSAIDQWKDYPDCLKQYPTKLKPKFIKV